MDIKDFCYLEEKKEDENDDFINVSENDFFSSKPERDGILLFDESIQEQIYKILSPEFYPDVPTRKERKLILKRWKKATERQRRSSAARTRTS